MHFRWCRAAFRFNFHVHQYHLYYVTTKSNPLQHRTKAIQVQKKKDKNWQTLTEAAAVMILFNTFCSFALVTRSSVIFVRFESTHLIWCKRVLLYGSIKSKTAVLKRLLSNSVIRFSSLEMKWCWNQRRRRSSFDSKFIFSSQGFHTSYYKPWASLMWKSL